MEERKNGMVPEEEGPPPIEFMYRGIPNLRCADLPAGGVMEADVVVVGCGGAGIAAAVSAFENGAKRVVINRSGRGATRSWPGVCSPVRARCCARR